MQKEEIHVAGVNVDAFTRCKHYDSNVDIIAVKYKCCDKFYSCYECHLELADHEPEVWGEHQTHEEAVFCGSCRNKMTIHDYLNSGNECPTCGSAFNPGCANHYHLYFSIGDSK